MSSTMQTSGTHSHMEKAPVHSPGATLRFHAQYRRDFGAAAIG